MGNMESWTPMIVSVVGMATAWLEFNATAKKMTRYSDVLHNVNAMVSWWQHLTDVDRASWSNIDRFIVSCEDILATERQAWLSTSMVSNMLAKESEKDDTGG